MGLEYDLGLNVLQRMFSKAFDVLQCDELQCMSYNVNLDLVLRLFEKFPTLSKVAIWSNTEKIVFSPKNKTKVLEYVEQGKFTFSHVSENDTIIHGKLFNFKKNGRSQFLGIGSSNLSEGSNQNFESILYVYDNALCEQLWNDIPKACQDLNISPQESAPKELYQTQASEVKLDPKLLAALWAHQKAILSWLASKQYSIVNIPPGTGKTEIAFAYLQYLFETDNSLTGIVLVPTTTLIKQWNERLQKKNITSQEWGTSLTNLESYLANPDHKVLVTLYERFFEQYMEYQNTLKIMGSNILLVLDECHNSYGHIEDLLNFKQLVESAGQKIFIIGLSATIDSFKVWEVDDFVAFMGGQQNRFNISLQSFYSHWNTLNPTLVLKPINYTPIKYCLSVSEMEKLASFSKKIAIEMGRTTLGGQEESTAAIQRARWMRGLQGGVDILKNHILTHMSDFSNRATVIFVQTNEIAEDLREFIARQPGWNRDASIYVYDSAHDQEYLTHAMTQFKKHLGFCLISEKMLSEGFDLPKIDRVILHGSDRSPRDWIQKIGRAIRFDRNDPDSIAQIVDVVFCEPNASPLKIEKERFECLSAINK